MNYNYQFSSQRYIFIFYFFTISILGKLNTLISFSILTMLKPLYEHIMKI